MTFSDFKPGDNKAITELFKLHKGEFIGWANKTWKHEKTEALTLWIDTVLVFRRKVWLGHTFENQAALKTYLFGIAKFINRKNQIRWHKQQKSVQLMEDVTHIRFADIYIDGGDDETFFINEKVSQLKKQLDRLGKNCKDILLHADLYQWNLGRIAEHFGYKNSDVVKTRKSRCKKKLINLHKPN